MDEDQNSEETSVEIDAAPIIVQMFEGDIVVDMEAKLPAITVQMSEGYPRGTHLRMNVEFRVKAVRYEPDRKGNLVRQHVLALESAQMVAAFDPSAAVDSVGGSASGQPQQTPEEAAALGLQFGRTSDTWDVPQSA